MRHDEREGRCGPPLRRLFTSYSRTRLFVPSAVSSRSFGGGVGDTVTVVTGLLALVLVVDAVRLV